jgi:hypothetical protein
LVDLSEQSVDFWQTGAQGVGPLPVLPPLQTNNGDRASSLAILALHAQNLGLSGGMGGPHQAQAGSMAGKQVATALVEEPLKST